MATKKKKAKTKCPRCSSVKEEETRLYVTYGCGTRFAKELNGPGRYCLNCEEPKSE